MQLGISIQIFEFLNLFDLKIQNHWMLMNLVEKNRPPREKKEEKRKEKRIKKSKGMDRTQTDKSMPICILLSLPSGLKMYYFF